MIPNYISSPALTNALRARDDVDGSFYTPNQEQSTFLITASANTLDEGDSVTFTLRTSNVDAGTVLPFDVQDASPNGGGVITVSDFAPALAALVPAGSFTVGEDGTATVTLTLAQDGATEGTEGFNVALQNGQAFTSTIVVNDTSTTDTGNVVNLTVPSTAPVTAAAGAEVFALDLVTAFATADDTQIQINGFSTADDRLRIDVPDGVDTTGISSLNQLNELDLGNGNVVAVQSNQITNNITINFGLDATGDAVAITLDGITTATDVDVTLI